MRKRLTIASVLAAVALTLTACGNDDEGGSDSAESFNDADVAFAQGMIPHHRQAVEMAQLAPDRASSPEVKELAENIESAQEPEIETMTNWLEAWGEDVPAEDEGMAGMDHGGETMPGEMTEEEMTELEAASGAEFDQMFLTMMIQHHEGAIEMAKTEQSEGENPDALELAKQIETDQTAEIQTIEELLES